MVTVALFILFTWDFQIDSKPIPIDFKPIQIDLKPIPNNLKTISIDFAVMWTQLKSIKAIPTDLAQTYLRVGLKSGWNRFENINQYVNALESNLKSIWV